MERKKLESVRGAGARLLYDVPTGHGKCSNFTVEDSTDVIGSLERAGWWWGFLIGG